MGTGFFFHAGPVDGLILDCYRLAEHYGRPPDEFLKMPLSKVSVHMRWTAKLIELRREQQDSDGG
jgi:hypothetical protein